MENEEREDVKSRLLKWLVEEGYSVRQQDDPKSHWHLVITNPIGINIDILQQIGEKDLVAIVAGLNIPPEEQKRKAELREFERQNLFWDLRFSLLMSHFDFAFQPSTENLQNILVSDVLWYDGPSKTSLMKTIGHVSNGLILVLWKLQRKFGAPAPKQEPKYVK